MNVITEDIPKGIVTKIDVAFDMKIDMSSYQW